MSKHKKPAEQIDVAKQCLAQFGKCGTNDKSAVEFINAVNTSAQRTRAWLEKNGVQITNVREFFATTFTDIASQIAQATNRRRDEDSQDTSPSVEEIMQEFEGRTQHAASTIDFPKDTKEPMRAMKDIPMIIADALSIAERYPMFKEKIPSYSETCTLQDGRKVLILGEHHGNPDAISDLGKLMTSLEHAENKDIVFFMEGIDHAKLEKFRDGNIDFAPNALVVAKDIATKVGIRMEDAILSASRKKTFFEACNSMNAWVKERTGIDTNLQPEDLAVFIGRCRGGIIAQTRGLTGKDESRVYQTAMLGLVNELGLEIDDKLVSAWGHTQMQALLEQTPEGGKAMHSDETIGWHILRETSDRITEPLLRTLLQKHHDKKYIVFVTGRNHVTVIKKVLNHIDEFSTK